MSRSEGDNSLERDDLPPLHPLLNIDDPPPDQAPPRAPEPSRHPLLQIQEAAPASPRVAPRSKQATPPQPHQEAVKADEQPESIDPQAAHHGVEAALAAAAAPAMGTAQRPKLHPLRGKGKWLVAAVAITTLILIPLIWRELGRIGAGGDVLKQWVHGGEVPLPDSVIDPQRLDIRPRRAIRPANFFGDGQYAYELWQPGPNGARLVAKYLLTCRGGEFKLQAAFDAATQQRMMVEN